MNTTYFQTTINDLNRATQYLTKYTTCVQNQIAAITTTPTPGAVNFIPYTETPCGKLAKLSLQSTEKLSKTLTDVTTKTNKATADAIAMVANNSAQLATLSALMIAPTDLTGVLAWINKMIETFTGPYNTYTGQQIVLAAQISQLTVALVNFTSAVTSVQNELTSDIYAAQTTLHCSI